MLFLDGFKYFYLFLELDFRFFISGDCLEFFVFFYCVELLELEGNLVGIEFIFFFY